MTTLTLGLLESSGKGHTLMLSFIRVTDIPAESCGSMWTQTCPLSCLSHTSSMTETVSLVQVKYSCLSHTLSTIETVCPVQTSTGYGKSIHASIFITYMKKRYWILLKPSRTPP